MDVLTARDRKKQALTEVGVVFLGARQDTRSILPNLSRLKPTHAPGCRSLNSTVAIQQVQQRSGSPGDLLSAMLRGVAQWSQWMLQRALSNLPQT
jgi:hypothetical protein